MISSTTTNATNRPAANDLDDNDPQKTQKLAGTAEGGDDQVSADDTKRDQAADSARKSGEDMDPSGAGEDDGGAPIDGKDDHVRDDQKPTSR